MPKITEREQMRRRHKADLTASAAGEFEPRIGIEIAQLDSVEPTPQLSSASGMRV